MLWILPHTDNLAVLWSEFTDSTLLIASSIAKTLSFVAFCTIPPVAKVQGSTDFETVKVFASGTVATKYVPLYASGRTPEITTLSPTARPCAVAVKLIELTENEPAVIETPVARFCQKYCF